MTTLDRHIPDPDRSLVRDFRVRSLPAGVRVGLGLLAAALLLWPLAPLMLEALSTDAWSSRTLSAVWSSVWRAAVAASLGVALSIPIGWALARLAVPARRLVRALLTLPVVAPALSVSLGLAWLLGDGWPLLLLANAGFGLAVGVRLGGAAWLALDPRQSETARSLGLDRWQVARWHLVPALGPAYLAVWALAFALAVSSFGTAHLLAAATSPTLPQLAGAVVGGAIAPGDAAAAIVLVVLVTVALVAFLRFRPGHALPGAAEYQPLSEVPPLERLLLAAAFLAAFALALGPLFALLHGAVTIDASEQITGGNVAAIFDGARPFEVDPLAALQRSLTLAVAAVLVALPLGLVLAVLVAPLRGWSGVAVETALLLPLFVPVAIAAGLRSAALDSPRWLLLIHLGIALPLVIRTLLPGTRSQLHSQFEAATLLGASAWESWSRLAAGPIRAHLTVAAALALLWSLGEVGAALLLHRVDNAPLGAAIVRLLAQQSAAADGRAVAVAAMLLLPVLIAFVTIEYRRSREIAEF